MFIICFLATLNSTLCQLGMTAILAWIIPDIPKEIENQVKRENVLAREALRSADQYDAGSPEPPKDHRGENEML